MVLPHPAVEQCSVNDSGEVPEDAPKCTASASCPVTKVMRVSGEDAAKPCERTQKAF